MYWLNGANGEIYDSVEMLPKKRGHLYRVINRESLFFKRFSLNTAKRVKDSDILNIQGHFVPFRQSFTNIIYSAETANEKRFFSWVGGSANNGEIQGTDGDADYFYDEIPESLVFRGEPGQVKLFSFFVFKRASGYEVIYFDSEAGDFYPVFEKDLEAVGEALLILLRKFPSVSGRARVLSEIDIPGLDDFAETYGVEVRPISGEEQKKSFFLPDYYPVKKAYSNISRSRQIKSIKEIIGRWNKYLTVIIILLAILLAINGAGYFILQSEKEALEKKFSTVGRLMGQAETMEMQLHRLRESIAAYPDHQRFMKTVADAIGPETTLTFYTLKEHRIVIQGFGSSSLDIIERLRKSGEFRDVKLKSTVTRSEYLQREKFEIEITLKSAKNTPPETGTEPEAQL